MSGIRINELEQKFGLKKSKIYLLIKQGLLPKPRKIGSASIWRKDEVDQAFEKLMGPISINSESSNSNGE